MNMKHMRAIRLALLTMLLAPASAESQWATVSEQVYLPGPFNWQFRKNYPSADRLFNAFDYGHAILYEKLWTQPAAPVSLLEDKEYAFITQKLLVNPPGLPLEESAIEVSYVKMAPEAKMMFEWAHLLHRQIYDVWADERMHPAEKDSRIRQLLQYYKSRKDLAFSSVPKNMDLMEGQPYSLAFRNKYPKFNGLIWAYHWLQIGLYEPLLSGQNGDERQTGVLATVARFRQMLENSPANMPRVMPMTPAVAPLFTARYPEAAIIFDNLHGMHDVISDILANPSVPRQRKRAEILLAARRYRDDTSFVMTRAEWLDMAKSMGVENMGGPAGGLLADLPEPTVETGAAVDHAAMGHGPTPLTDSRTASTSADSATVAKVVSDYHAALSNGDSTGALALLAPDAVILESGGIETRAEYRSHHLASDIAFARAVRTTRSPVVVRVVGNSAWTSSTSVAQGTFNGRAVNSSGAESMVLTRSADGWRIRAIHWSSRTRR